MTIIIQMAVKEKQGNNRKENQGNNRKQNLRNALELCDSMPR
jgi:hypothetical protein